MFMKTDTFQDILISERNQKQKEGITELRLPIITDRLSWKLNPLVKEQNEVNQSKGLGCLEKLIGLFGEMCF